MDMKLGSAPDSWGIWFPDDPKQTPWTRFLNEIAEAGYEWTELGPFGYLPTDPVELREELESRHLRLAAGFVFNDFSSDTAWPDIENEVRKVGALVAELGGRFGILIQATYTDLFTGASIMPARLEGEDWERLCRNLERAGRLFQEEFGLSGILHPHAETAIEYEDQIERVLKDTDGRYLNLCFDVGHHAYRDGDPVAFMRDHLDRIPYLHLKSVDGKVRERVAKEHIPFAHAVAQDMFVEPAMGEVDFVGLRDLLLEVDYSGFGIVEQDMYPAPFEKPLPIAKRTRRYLAEMGIG